MFGQCRREIRGEGAERQDVLQVMAAAKAAVELSSKLADLERAINEMASEYSTSRNIKQLLWSRMGTGDRRACPRCGLEKYYADFERDHIIPKARIRIDADENIQLICGDCNARKGTKV